jgi:hypothetical protein
MQALLSELLPFVESMQFQTPIITPAEFYEQLHG